MTTYPTLKIVKGNRSIDLNDRVNFYLRTDLVPPETNQATQIATGSALNLAGGRVVARKPQTRSWTFSVRVVGTTDADIINQLRGVKALLSQAGDANEPVKIQYKPNSDTPEPLWGQFGALLNYEVLSGRITIGPDYMKGARRAKAVVATFEFTIQPYAVGKQQRVCSAMGGVIEDTLGAVDGRSRGLIVPEATTNLHTNPVFGNSAYDNGWTAGANLIKSKVTDSQRVPFGFASVSLTAVNTTNNTFEESITLTAASYRLSYYVMKIDRSAVTVSDCAVAYDGTAQSSTYESLGNGLYKIYVSVTGTAAAHTCGVAVINGRSIIVCGAQCELKAYNTPLCHGDLLGCAWAGTAHASASTRTVSACKIGVDDSTLRFGAWTVRAVVKSPYANTMSQYWFVFDARDGTYTAAPYCYYDPATDKYVLAYSGVTAASAALTFSAGTIHVIHAVCTGSTISLYVNGILTSTSGAFSAAAFGANLFIGSTYTPNTHGNQTTLGFATFDQALTATQIAADYANAAAVLADGARLESVPWLWTKDGDDIVDNCNDATRDNWCVVGGVDGNAQTPIRLHATPTALEPNGVWLANNHAAVFVKPDPLFLDYNTNADTSCSGGGYGSGAINTTGANIAVSALSQTEYKYLLAGKEAIVFTRVEVSAGTLSLKTRILSGSTVLYESDWITTAAVAVVFELFKTYPIRALDSQNDAIGIAGNPQIQLLGKASAGTPTVSIDYACVMAGDFVEYLARHSASSKMIVFENKAVCTDSSDLFTENMPTTGRVPLSVYPDEFNILMVQMGYVGGSNTVADTFTIGALYVTPRHELL